MAFIFQKVGRGTAEIYKVLKNGTTSALYGGTPVCYDYTTDSNGKTVILPTTAAFQLFAGVVANGKTLAASGEDGQWGKVQIYGHHAGIYVGGSSIIVGNPLVPKNAVSYMTLGVTNVATANAQIQFAVAGAIGCTLATSTFGARGVGFIRAM